MGIGLSSNGSSGRLGLRLACSIPNVVTIFDSGTDRDTAFLVMELLPGPTLDGYVAQQGPLPEREAVALAGQVASGLAAAHGAGVAPSLTSLLCKAGGFGYR